MLPSTYEDQDCAVAKALEVIGERWTLLIVRDALLGIRRFEDFQARLGVSRTVLAARLSQLVEHGVLERSRYQQGPDRFEYLLTDRGLELWPAILALAQWGAHRTPGGTPPRDFRHRVCGTPVHAEVRCPECDVDLKPDETVSEPAPGAPVSRADHISETVLAALSQERPLLQPVR
jgi:DNA-binding HxlR family transcriptional regulator